MRVIDLCKISKKDDNTILEQLSILYTKKVIKYKIHNQWISLDGNDEEEIKNAIENNLPSLKNFDRTIVITITFEDCSTSEEFYNNPYDDLKITSSKTPIKNQSKIKVYIIRENWLREQNFKYKINNLLLRDNNNKMDALGHFMIACDINPKHIEGKLYPNCIDMTDAKNNSKIQWLFDIDDPRKMTNSTDALEIININDRRGISDNEREELIKEIFAKHNVEIYFK